MRCRLLQGNNIVDIGVTNFLPVLPKLKYLFLYSNPIANITNTAFRNVTDVRMLLLQYVNLITIPSGAFHYLVNLQFLWIHNSNVMYIEDGAFDNLFHLEQLVLNDNSISYMPVGLLRDLNKLHFMDVTNNAGLHSMSCCQLCGVPPLTHINLKAHPNKTVECSKLG